MYGRPPLGKSIFGISASESGSEATQSILSFRLMDCFVASLAKMGWTAPDGISVPDW
jgi:hypothetical protein